MVISLHNDYLDVEFSTYGGSLSSIKDKQGTEYLWQGDPTYWSGQAPVLFPICGSLRNDWAIYLPRERPYFTGIMPRHGIVRKKDFKLEYQCEDEVAFSIFSTDEMLSQFPYKFRLMIRYHLIGSKIQVSYEVTNLEEKKTLPYFIGGHPGFNCPIYSDERYRDYYLEFETEETCTVPKQLTENGLLDLQDRKPFLDHQKELDLDFSLFAEDAITLDQLQSRAVTLRSRKHNSAVRVEFTDFPYLVLWSTTNKGLFIAIEPWSGLSTSREESDNFQEKRNVSLVEPGRTDTKQFSIEIQSEGNKSK